MQHGVVMPATKSVIRVLLGLSLAIGLAAEAQAGSMPTPTATPGGSPTATPTSTPTGTPAGSPTATPTSTPTGTPTGTPTPTPTAGPTGTPTTTPTATPTATPTGTPSATPTAAPTPQPSATLDSFLCYKAKRARREPKFQEEGVTLFNQFDELEEPFEARTVDLFKNEQFCSPVEITMDMQGQQQPVTFPIIDPTASLTCYKVKRPTSVIKPEVISSTDQFGDLDLTVQRGKNQLCVPSQATAIIAPTPTPTPGGTATATPAPPLPLEHFELYKAKRTPRTPKFEKIEVHLMDPLLQLDETVKVTRPVQLGVPTDKNEEGITNSTTHMTCFSVQAPRFKWRDVVVGNQFGDWFRLTVKRPNMLCVPSYKLVVSEE